LGEAEVNPQSARPPAAAPGLPPWSQLWQVPLLVAGVVLLGVGLYLALPRGGARNVGPGLDEAAAYLKVKNLPEATQRLQALGRQMEQAPAAERARYALLCGDLASQTQPAETAADPAALHQLVSDYQQAQSLGDPLDATHLERLALAQGDLDQDDQALATVKTIPGPPQRRYSVIRKIIERHLEQGRGEPAAMGRLLEAFSTEVAGETDPDRQRSGNLWVLCLRMQGLLTANQSDAVIAQLPRELGTLLAAGRGSEHELAPLDLVLAEAYEKSGDRAQAEDSYVRAQKRLDSGAAGDAEAYAQTLVALGRLALADYRADPTVDAHLDEAMRRFTAAGGYPATRVYLESLIGQADCEARLGEHGPARAHLAAAVGRLIHARHPDARLAALAAEAGSAAAQRASGPNDAAEALAYVEVLAPLYGAAPPPEYLLLSGQVHERLALQLNAQAEAGKQASADTATGTATQPAGGGGGLWRAQFLDAARNFDAAGDAYQRHAHAVVTNDVDAYASSVWHAAGCFDRAGRADRAREFYAEFIRVHPNDPNALKAMARQGLALMADGQYAAAADQFRRLYEGNPISPDTNDCLVPLARCEVALGDFAKAEGYLLAVVGGQRALTPDSDAYRQALIELGRLYGKTDRYESAIERLSEAVTRYGKDAEGPVLKFNLAEAYRQSAPRLLHPDSADGSDAATQPAPPEPPEPPQAPLSSAPPACPETGTRSQRVALEAERVRRLTEAQNLYRQVVESLRARDGAGLSEVESLCYRNAYFYRADCAYDLGRFPEAIALYDEAAKRWSKHPASLIALVQIVNAYCELGRIDDARRANQRACDHLKDIPREAFNDPTLPMSRREWEQWYRWSSDRGLFDNHQASAVPVR
jgi:tetratricopeptide (TPR) repeat protein